jgi:hypothetical protein
MKNSLLPLLLLLAGFSLMGLAACTKTEAKPLQVNYYYLPG